MDFSPVEFLSQPRHPPVQIDAHRPGSETRPGRDLRPRHALDETQNQRLAVSLRQEPDNFEDRLRLSFGRILGRQVFGQFLGPGGAAHVVGRVVAGDHRDPSRERRRVAKGGQSTVHRQEDLLDQVFDFQPGDASEEDSVNQPSVAVIQPLEGSPVAPAGSLDPARLVANLGSGGLRHGLTLPDPQRQVKGAESSVEGRESRDQDRGPPAETIPGTRVLTSDKMIRRSCNSLRSTSRNTGSRSSSSTSSWSSWACLSRQFPSSWSPAPWPSSGTFPSLAFCSSRSSPRSSRMPSGTRSGGVTAFGS